MKDRNGYPLRIGQTCIAYRSEEVPLGAGVITDLDITEQRNVCVRWKHLGYGLVMRPKSLIVVAPKPLRWVPFVNCFPTRDDADTVGEVYYRFRRDPQSWLYGFYSLRFGGGSVFPSAEWLSGVRDQVEFAMFAASRGEQGSQGSVEHTRYIEL